jgi:hypothetical protein
MQRAGMLWVERPRRPGKPVQLCDKLAGTDALTHEMVKRFPKCWSIRLPHCKAVNLDCCAPQRNQYYIEPLDLEHGRFGVAKPPRPNDAIRRFQVVGTTPVALQRDYGFTPTTTASFKDALAYESARNISHLHECRRRVLPRWLSRPHRRLRPIHLSRPT